MKNILLFTITMLFAITASSQQEDRWKVSASNLKGIESNGVSLGFSFPFSKTKNIGFLTIQPDLYFIKDKSYWGTDEDGNSGDYIYIKNHKSVRLSFKYDYRISVGDKFEIIPSVGLFGEWLNFKHQLDNEPLSSIRTANIGDGGIVLSLNFNYIINDKIGVIAGFDFTGIASRNRSLGSTYAKLGMIRLGVTF